MTNAFGDYPFQHYLPGQSVQRHQGKRLLQFHQVLPGEIVEGAFLGAVEHFGGVVDVEGVSRRIGDAEVLEPQIMALAGDPHAGAVVVVKAKALEADGGDVGEIVGLGIARREHGVGVAHHADRGVSRAREVAQRKAAVGAGLDLEGIAGPQLQGRLRLRIAQVA